MTTSDLRDQIETRIRQLLDDKTVIFVLHELIDRQRTKLIKDCLCELGHSLGYRVAASGCDADDVEWLYDMVWLTLSDDCKVLYSQAMVMECEWKWSTYAQADEIDLDFQKLVQGRSDVRVWICAVPDEESGLKKIANCREQVEKFTMSIFDDAYLFVILAWKEKSYKIEKYSALIRSKAT